MQHLHFNGTGDQSVKGYSNLYSAVGQVVSSINQAGTINLYRKATKNRRRPNPTRGSLNTSSIKFPVDVAGNAILTGKNLNARQSSVTGLALQTAQQ